VASSTPLLPLAQSYLERDPLAAAHCIENMDEEDALTVLSELPPASAAQVFPHLQVNVASNLLSRIPPELFKEVIPRLGPHQAASIILSMEPVSRQKLIDSLPEKSKEEIRELLTYPEHSAGKVMSTDFVALRQDVNVQNAVERIRTLVRKKNPASYAYVVDHENHLVGIITMRDLLLSNPDTQLGEFMNRNVFTVNAFMDLEEVAGEVSKRKFFVVPVVDHEKKLLGLVKADQLIGYAQSEATEDLVKMFGAGSTESTFSPILYSLSKRQPWLHFNLLTAFLAAGVVSLFESTIAQITALAVFLPVVAGQGGNAGNQSLAIVMRGLVLREIPKGKVWKLIAKETLIGLINGVSIGLVTSLIAWVWYGNAILGVVIGLAMIVNLVVAGLFGAAIPLIMKALGFDPAQSSSIVLTTFTDVVGFLAFLGFARIFMNYLM